MATNKKITVSVKDTTRNNSSYDTRKVAETELNQVKESLAKVLTTATKKYKTTTEANEFLEALTKSISNELGSQLISIKLLILKQSIQAILPDMISTITEEAAKFNKLRIVEEANTLFKKEATSIIIKLLGMREDSWDRGRLEIDNCNGRQSAVSQFILNTSGQIITNLVKEELAKFDKNELPKIKASISSTVVKRIKNEINDNMYRNLTFHVEQRTNEITRQLIDEAIEKNDLYKSLLSSKSDD